MCLGARINGRVARPGQVLATGDTVRLPEPTAPNGTLDILRETEELFVLNKPAGLPTVALAGQSGDSMAARLVASDPEARWPGPALESGIGHRLDAGTSGVLLVARTETLWSELRQQTREHAWEKTYLSVVEGQLEGAREVHLAIGQHRKSRRRMVGVSDPTKASRYGARAATSRIEPLHTEGSQTLVRVQTNTGLRHQVRVHLASIDHPVINDGLYGNPGDPELPGHYLHGETISWHDPALGADVVDRAPIPKWWPQWVQDHLARP